MTINRTRRHRSLLTLVAAGAVLALHGCGGGDEPGRKQLGGVPPQEVTCSGVDLTGLSSVVYATPGGDASASCGGIDNPCGSVQAAIDKCDAHGCAVLAGMGDFPPAQVRLREGVHVLGGCQLRPEWDPRWRTVFNGPASGAAAVVADSIPFVPPIFPPTRFEGVVVMAAAGGAPGAPSVAMLLTGTTGVTMLNSTLVSGPGATGATGFTAPPSINRDGKPGQGRMDNGIPGAAGGQSPYGGLPGGYGGRGGNRYDYTKANMHCPRIEAAGEVGGSAVAPSPFSLPGGPGGGAGLEGSFCANADGERGHTGGRGIGGFIAVAPAPDSSPDLLGKIVGTTWVGHDGSPGEGRGSPGYGAPGGGGGGAGGRIGSLVGVIAWSGPGAGGGGGGAGGDPGGGGGQGGASIALLMIDSSIPGIPANHGLLIPGPGGTGGAGGAGSSGGLGGFGQLGWSRDLPDIQGFRAGNGGLGGNGGDGGGGGGGTGGNGGPSIGVALFAGSPVPVNDYIYNPSPGQGGAPGRGAPSYVSTSGDPVVPGPDGKSGKPSVPLLYIFAFP